MENKNLTEKEILEHKFAASKNGYNPFEVDKFLDLIVLTIVELNRQIKSLNNDKKEKDDEIDRLNNKIEDLKNEFQLFKNKFKNIKEEDILNNRSNFELLKKVNIYERKLNELGVDINKL